MYSKLIDGGVLDFRFKRRDMDTLFYIGDIYLWKIFKGRNKWAAVYKNPHPMSSFDGFSSRHTAAEFLIKWFDIERGIE